MSILKTKIICGELVAWDPVQQKAAWRYKHKRVWNGGTLATAGNLVFQGTADHQFMAFNAKNGDVLWSSDIKLGVVAAPITYSVDGEQYVALMAKWGGAIPLAIGLEPFPGLENGRLVVFKLGGKAQLPAVVATIEEPVEPPAMTITNAKDIAEGKDLYLKYCSACHGDGVIGGGTVPDLRRMPLAFHGMFKAIVLGGALESNGMANFSDVLDETKADKIYAFILQQAHADYKVRTDTSMMAPVRLWVYDKIADAIVLAFDKSIPFFIGVAVFWIMAFWSVWRLIKRKRVS